MPARELPDQPTFTLAEVAQVSGFTRRSIEDACRDGRIAHRHFGRQRVLTRDQLAAFLASVEVDVQPKPKAPPAELALIAEHRGRVAARLARRGGRAAA
jgi:hypothetical protein